jgi:hypothetical protein
VIRLSITRKIPENPLAFGVFVVKDQPGWWPVCVNGEDARMLRRLNLKAHIAVSVASLSMIAAASAQLSKVDRLLQKDGFQLQAAASPDGTFYFNGHDGVLGYTQANYTAPSWAGGARFSDSNGVPITGPWATWNVDLGTLPDQVPADVPHLPDLVSMAIGDEQNWESDSSVNATVSAEFQAVNADPNYNNTIVYTNNFKGQLQLDGTGVSSFIQNNHPDMLTFDWYPYTTGNATAPDDSVVLNTPFDSWYTEMRFYRDVTLDNSYQSSNPNYSVAWGLYRQIYSTDDGTRPPSASEYALETSTAIAFNAKYLSDFIYNGSASQLFSDTNQHATTPFYNAVQSVNARAKNLGKPMVYLTALNTNPDLNWATGTPDILMLRGQQVSGNTTTPNTLPNGFQPSSSNAFSAWTSGVNDPWMTGFGQVNIGGTVNQFTNASGKTQAAMGDAFISWFRPINEDKTTATSKGDIYFMLVNALSSPTATPAQCEQDIHMDFTTWPLAPGQTEPSIQYLDQNTGQLVTLFINHSLDGLITNSSLYPSGTFLLTKTNANGTGKLRLNVFLDGGDSFLFKFNTGTTFAGFSVPEPGCASIIAFAGLIAYRRRRQ